MRSMARSCSIRGRTVRRPGATSALFILAALLLAGGCRREVREPVYDLLQLFPFTELGFEAVTVEFADVRARRYLGEGWSGPETLVGGETVAWTTKRKAELHFHLLRAAEREMVLRCASFPARAGRPQRIAIHLNGVRLAALTLEEGMKEHRVRLPARLQQVGRNTLSFSGGARGRTGQRIGVAYQSIRFLPAPGQRLARAAVTEDALILSAPARTDYFLRIPPAAELVFGLDAPQAQLRVVMQQDGESEQTLFIAGGARSSAVLDLSAYAGKLARVGVEALGEETRVEVVRPQIRALRRKADAPVPRSMRANVLLYVIDTLRADHLGCYGYGRPTSPRIDDFARSGILFTDAIAQASWTRPATASILTGLYPPAHGASTLRHGVRLDVPTLAELLEANGYRTGAFVTNVNVVGKWGFQRGFGVYEYLPEDEASPAVHARSDELNARAVPWLRKSANDPFFLYVHATDPHAPYMPPPEYAEKLAAGSTCLPGGEGRVLLDRFEQQPNRVTPAEVRELEACYDAEIAFTDSNFGALLDELTRLGLDDDTIVVLTADHGEEFFEHQGFEHGRTLYREQLHIPLVLRLPGRQGGRRVSVRARQIDILPTLLDHLGLPAPAPVQGRSLLPLLDSTDPGSAADAFAQTHLGRRQLEAVITDDWKVVQTRFRGTDRMEAYDLRNDVQERGNAIDRRPVLRGYARQAMAAWLVDVPRAEAGAPAVQPEADSALMERLRVLGYTE